MIFLMESIAAWSICFRAKERTAMNGSQRTDADMSSAAIHMRNYHDIYDRRTEKELGNPPASV